jgi:hypothetical protein
MTKGSTALARKRAAAREPRNQLAYKSTRERSAGTGEVIQIGYRWSHRDLYANFEIAFLRNQFFVESKA